MRAIQQKLKQHLVAVAAAAVAATLAPRPVVAQPLSEEPSRVIYQVYVRAFFDGSPTPDMEGDFAGLEARIDYLRELGVDTLLLMPVFYSTGDMGYIPRDYQRLDPAYGNEAQLRHFVATMHAAGIKILLDSPVNHISYDSAWFLRGSQRRCDPNDVAYDPADPGNKYCDYFYFSADPCHEAPYRYWHKPWLYDQTDCNAVWFRRPQFDPSYHRPERVYATFFAAMPDLKYWDFAGNRWNQPVVDDVQAFFDHWAEAGVDGFRIDAAKHFVEGATRNDDALEPRNRELLARFLSGVRAVNPDVSFLGEIASGHADFEPYLPRSLDMVLDFPFMNAVRAAVGGNYGEPFKAVLEHFAARQDVIKPGNRVVFAGNHDFTRMMSEWGDDVEKWRLAHFLTFTQPFVPLLYYGEEIGMHGRVKRPDSSSNEEYVRTVNAFPWTGEDTAGFPGTGTPVAGLADNHAVRNLAEAEADPESTLHMIQQLLRIRRDFVVTNATQLFVRQDLYGHVIGWTLAQPIARRDRFHCLSMLVNFHPSDSYTITAAHASPSCESSHEEVFAQNAERRQNGQAVQYTLHPYARVILAD
jgi:glycosidase